LAGAQQCAPAFSCARPVAKRGRLACHGRAMTRAQALSRLRAHEAELRGAGVGALWLFGSVARDEAGAGSDVDVAINIAEAGERVALFELLDIQLRLEDILAVKVDMVEWRAFHPRRRARIKVDLRRAW
jgi:predicted nucleotidyltransferase